MLSYLPLLFFSILTSPTCNWTNELTNDRIPTGATGRQKLYRASPCRLEEPNGGRSTSSRRERTGIKRCERCSPPPSNKNYRPLKEERTVTVIYRQQESVATDGHTSTETTTEKQTTAVATSGSFSAVDQTDQTLDLNALTVPYPGLESEREGAAQRATERVRRGIIKG